MFIVKKVTINAIDLDENIEKNILIQIKKDFIGNCFKEYGYILDIEKLIDFSENCISETNSSIIFKTQFEAKTLKPNVGDIVNGVIDVIGDFGIILLVENLLKIFISGKTSFKKYKLIDQNSCNADGKKYKKGDILTVKIKTIRYLNKKFDCLGSIQ
jgi:DNA-directed RNA polymerase subunit E'/Rpb7